MIDDPYKRAIVLSQRKYLCALEISKIRKACIEACMQAMIEERRFVYTDLFRCAQRKF